MESKNGEGVGEGAPATWGWALPLARGWGLARTPRKFPETRDPAPPAARESRVPRRRPHDRDARARAESRGAASPRLDVR